MNKKPDFLTSPEIKDGLVKNEIPRCDLPETLWGVRGRLSKALRRAGDLDVFDECVGFNAISNDPSEFMISLFVGHGKSRRVVHLTGLVSLSEREIQLEGQADGP